MESSSHSNSNTRTSSGSSPFSSDTSLERYASILEEAKSIKGVSLWKDAWRRLKRNRAAILSCLFLAIISLLAIFTPILPLQAPIVTDLGARKLAPPNMEPVSLGQQKDLKFKDNSLLKEFEKYQLELAKAKKEKNKKNDKKAKPVENIQDPIAKLWNNPGPIVRFMIRIRMAIFGDWCIPSIFGTDTLGRDMLSRIFWGGRISLAVGVIATLVSLIIGVSYGAIAGYLGGIVDAVMMRIVDVLYSLPFIFVVIFIITIINEKSVKQRFLALGLNEISVFFILIGAIYWLTMARVVRGQVISLKNELFVEAAKTVGANNSRIIFLHLIPNVLGIVIVYLTLTIPSIMLFEAFLSFLGLGVSPPDVSWGLLVNEGMKVITPVKIYWWLVVFPGLSFALTLFALNFFGDGLRDALDPRMKNK